MDISFNVKADSTPSTNIHAIIGQNGVGKTTLLNDIIDAITGTGSCRQTDENKVKISHGYIAGLVYASFSDFDRHLDIKNALIKALISCFYKPEKSKRWLNVIDKLCLDENFVSMKLEQLVTFYLEAHNSSINDEEFKNKYKEIVDRFLSGLSSVHAIILLIITRLVATVEEKTLVILDEPENNLHPLLLSAFMRAIEYLLHDRNGVAIIATNSPVVLQEIPRSCVWKIYRVGTNVTSSRPSIETFAEDVGVLSREVFGLNVENSGFHNLLTKAVGTGKTYNEILADYDNQIGFEGRAILASLIATRDRN